MKASMPSFLDVCVENIFLIGPILLIFVLHGYIIIIVHLVFQLGKCLYYFKWKDRLKKEAAKLVAAVFFP